MTRPVVQISLLALVSTIGIGAMLLAEGAWDWIFLVLAALPLLAGGIAIATRTVKNGLSRYH